MPRFGDDFARRGPANKAITSALFMTAVIVATVGTCRPGAAQANHKCDPVDPISDAGWSVVPSLETVGEVDGAPYQAGASEWFIERTTTLVPFCNYYNEIGIYSMRSYTLAPQVAKERIRICERTAAGGSGAVAPYAGPCPPM
jgi:hypothetical protein